MRGSPQISPHFRAHKCTHTYRISSNQISQSNQNLPSCAPSINSKSERKTPQKLNLIKKKCEYVLYLSMHFALYVSYFERQYNRRGFHFLFPMYARNACNLYKIVSYMCVVCTFKALSLSYSVSVNPISNVEHIYTQK